MKQYTFWRTINNDADECTNIYYSDKMYSKCDHNMADAKTSVSLLVQLASGDFILYMLEH